MRIETNRILSTRMQCEIRVPRRARAIAACTVLLAIGASSCGSGDSRTRAAAATPTATASAPRLAMLSTTDLDKAAAGPARTVLTLWFWAQWGSWPNVVTAYAPAVRANVGDGDIAGAYQQQRGSMEMLRPEIHDIVKTPKGTLVTTVLRPAGGPVVPDSWTLRQAKSGQWQIIHDTFLERSVGGYVQGVTQGRVAPAATKPDPRAQRAGAKAREGYQNLFLTGG
jgi:hypothetical protein